MFNLEYRNLRLVNTDPQRRCYNGCHAKSELQWSNWKVLEHHLPENLHHQRLMFWREINYYAVSQRGKSATSEYRIVQTQSQETTNETKYSTKA